jgi:hypothetical protein
MGTRSTYRVINQFTHPKTKKLVNDKLVLVYLQYDGYPDGHPLNTAEWLAKGKLVNGLSYNDDKNVFNGAGCLAAQLIERLKDGPGGTYIHPLSHRGKSWEDYTYDVIIKEGKTIEIVVYSVGGMDKPKFKKLFAGSPEEYVERYSKETA